VHEHAQLVPASLAVRAVPADAGQALGQHAAHVVVDGRVDPGRSEGAGRAGVAAVRLVALAGPDHPARADLAGPADHRGDRDRLAALDRRGDLAQLGETGLVHPLDEDIDDPAAGQADRERVVVADPVGLVYRVTGLADVQRQLVDGALDAAARHAADHLVVGSGRNRQRRTRVTGRAAVGTDHRGQAEALSRFPPLGDPAQDVTHRGHLRLSSRNPRHRPAYSRWTLATAARIRSGMSGWAGRSAPSSSLAASQPYLSVVACSHWSRPSRLTSVAVTRTAKKTWSWTMW